jgi:class 3 adenylate cyclase
MLIDLNDSVRLSETLGLEKFVGFLARFFQDSCLSIRKFHGEVHRYVGDELMVSWPLADGARCDHCLLAYVDLTCRLERQSQLYTSLFGLTPQFRSSIHVGPITSFEVDPVRSQHVFFGDGITTAARVMSECRKRGERLIVTGETLQFAHVPKGWRARQLARARLRGRQKPVDLWNMLALTDSGRALGSSS